MVDCCDLWGDLSTRLQSDEPLETIMSDLGYGIEAELNQLVSDIVGRLRDLLEDNMNNRTDSIRHSSSPEPTRSAPPIQ